jgi:hypothetical protein
VPIYENLVIGNFLFALGLKIGARRDDALAPDLGVHLLQQTPLDIVLGDVLLAGPRSVALLEFKRAADRRSKERGKLVAIEALLQNPKFQALRTTSRQMHFYVETRDILEEGFSRVLPYLDLLTDDRGSSLEQLVDDLAFRAKSAPVLAEMHIEACERYLELVCLCQGRSYHATPGLLVGVGGDGRIAFAPVEDVRNLRTTFAAIRAHEITQVREITRLLQADRLVRRQRLALSF